MNYKERLRECLTARDVLNLQHEYRKSFKKKMNKEQLSLLVWDKQIVIEGLQDDLKDYDALKLEHSYALKAKIESTLEVAKLKAEVNVLKESLKVSDELKAGLGSNLETLRKMMRTL